MKDLKVLNAFSSILIAVGGLVGGANAQTTVTGVHWNDTRGLFPSVGPVNVPIQGIGGSYTYTSTGDRNNGSVPVSDLSGQWTGPVDGLNFLSDPYRISQTTSDNTGVVGDAVVTSVTQTYSNFTNIDTLDLIFVIGGLDSNVVLRAFNGGAQVPLNLVGTDDSLRLLNPPGPSSLNAAVSYDPRAGDLTLSGYQVNVTQSELAFFRPFAEIDTIIVEHSDTLANGNPGTDNWFSLVGVQATVPEPSTALMGIAGGLLLLRRRR